METSNIQFGLIAAMAVGLGFSLASSDAVGYPAGASVSAGENPVWSAGGLVYGTAADVVTVPAGRDLVITDVALTGPYITGTEQTVLRLDGGEVLAHYEVPGIRNSSGGAIIHSMESGIRVPAGATLTIKAHTGAGVGYTLSGYFAQP